jgi:hypothetical protein
MKALKKKKLCLKQERMLILNISRLFNLATQIVERAYPPEDVATLRTYKKKYGEAVDVVAKDKCFYFAHNEAVDDDGDTEETKSHFDFGFVW